MRRVLHAVACVLVLVSPSWSAATTTPLSQFSLNTVDQLRSVATGMTPVPVTSHGVLPNYWGMSEVVPPSVAAGNPAYRTGTGVVLRVNRMMDTATGSICYLSYVRYSEQTASRVRADDPSASADFWFGNMTTPPTDPFASGTFRQMPYGQHTYMLTLKMQGMNLDTGVKLVVGNQVFQGAALNYNRAAHEMRVLFTYDAGGVNRGWVYAAAYKIGSDRLVRWAFIDIQLVQLN